MIMKLTNKIALISGLGCLALVGTGFAAWVYNDGTVNDVNTDGAATSVVAEGTGVTTNTGAADTIAKITLGTVTGTIELDEDAATTKTTGYYVGVASWKSFSVIANLVDADTTDAYPLVLSNYTLTYTITVPAAISNYVTVTAASTNWVSGTSIDEPTLAFNNGTSLATTKAPQNKTEYDAMAAALSGAKITFAFAAAYNA
jgi:hypothetical protein